MADWPPLKNAAFSFPVSFYTSAGVLVTNPTLAAGDCKLSTDFGALNPITILPDAEPDASAQVRVQCSAGEMNGNQIHIVFADQTSPKEWADFDVTIFTGATQMGNLVRSTTPANTLDVSATGEAGIDLTNIKQAAAPTTLTNITVPTVTTLTNDPVGVTTLLNRLGAFTGAGLNTVLGFLRAMMRKDAALTPGDVGGTFDNTTDSEEAIRDQVNTLVPGAATVLNAEITEIHTS